MSHNPFEREVRQRLADTPVNVPVDVPVILGKGKAARNRQRLRLAVGILGTALAVILAVVVGLIVSERLLLDPGPTPTGSVDPHATPSQTATPSPTLEALPRIRVNPTFAGMSDQVKNEWVAEVQRYADALADGDVAAIVEGCWRQPASDVRDDLMTATLQDRQADLDALTMGPAPADVTIFWGNTDTWEGLTFSRWEMDSPMACPMKGSFTANEAAWTIERLVGRHNGTPVNPADTEANYDLLSCENNDYEDGCWWIWQLLDGHIPRADTVRDGISPAQWDALAGATNLRLVPPNVLGLPEQFRLVATDVGPQTRYFIFGLPDYAAEPALVGIVTAGA